jgi:arsenite methyltransferase
MRRSLVDILIDPITKTSLQVEECQYGGEGDIVEGVLRTCMAKLYTISNGIPRFVLTSDSDQRQTANSFGFKWRQRHTYDSPQVRAAASQWLVQRYGFESIDDMRCFFGSRRRILDAGCGSGFSSSLWLSPAWGKERGGEWYGVDISLAIDVAAERLGGIAGTHFIQADILQLPFHKRFFDIIFSEGVLHHTPSTELALKSLVPFLVPEGQILFYVYRKKGPVREFTDDYIRNIVSQLDPGEAWNLLRPLTMLGQALAELHAEVEVAEDIPYLGLKAGRYDIQRLVYWNIAKLFWNQAYTFEENHHVNFDWYHPRYAHRHTEDEVRLWCEDAGLSLIHFDLQESGFTVRAIKT